MTKALRRTVAFGGPEQGAEQERHSEPEESSCLHVSGRERSSTISEGVSPRIPSLDVHSPLPPPGRASSSGAPRPIRTHSADANLSALQRLAVP